MRKKTWYLAAIATLLTAALVAAPVLAVNPSAPAAESTDAATLPTAKDEVVYANLTASGAVRGVYVVNILETNAAEKLLDYGSYARVTNLTDLTAPSVDADQVTVTAPAGKFYYQGDLPDAALPWRVAVSYALNGAPITPELLGGKSGRLELRVEIAREPGVNPAFFDNYLLQISMLLPGESCENITAPACTIANAGQDQLVNFTGMPGQDSQFLVTLDAKYFSFSGMDLAAIPFSMTFELPDTTSFTSQLTTLGDAIAALHSGAAALRDGAQVLSGGAASLADGTQEFASGLRKLNDQSAQLTQASTSISDALNAINTSLSGNSGQMDFGALSQLPGGLADLSGGLQTVGESMDALLTGYDTALTALEHAMGTIPDYQLSQTELQNLLQTSGNSPTAQKLIETYAAAATVKGTYQASKPGLVAVKTALPQLRGSIATMASQLDAVAAQLTAALSQSSMALALGQLQSGIGALAGSYAAFHTGLSQYTGGVQSLSGAYGALQTGTGELAHGASELAGGIKALRDGTQTLSDKTANLPGQITQEMNAMADRYSGLDFVPVSFVSAQNTTVRNVSFVLKLDGVSLPTPPAPEPAPEQTATFWTRLKALF